MTLSEPVRYFNETVEEYAAQYHAQSPGGHALRVRQQRVLELLDRAGGKVLDVGCGPGMLAEEMLGLGYEVWGVDAAPGMIAECHRQLDKSARTHFSVGDAANLAFADGFFDTVTCIGVIDRIEDHESVLKEMARIVRRNGTLIVSFPNLLSPYAAWKLFVFYPTIALLRPIYCSLAGHPQPLSPYRFAGFRRLLSPSVSDKLQTPRKAVQLMATHGLEVTDVVYFNFNVFLPPLDELFPHGAMKATERLERLRFGKLRWLAAGFILKARKSL
jgi:ubiquinone/menaquinone biosynthesis C-methylase UbiE